MSSKSSITGNNNISVKCAQVAQQTPTTISKKGLFLTLYPSLCSHLHRSLSVLLEINFSLMFSTSILTIPGFVSKAKQAAHAHFLGPQGLAFLRLLGWTADQVLDNCARPQSDPHVETWASSKPQSSDSSSHSCPIPQHLTPPSLLPVSRPACGNTPHIRHFWTGVEHAKDTFHSLGFLKSD